MKTTQKVEEMHRESQKKYEKFFEDLLDKGTSEEVKKVIDGLNALKKMLGEYGKTDDR